MRFVKKDVFFLPLCDFKKAFDTIVHEQLLMNLAPHGIGDVFFDWFRSNLSKNITVEKYGNAFHCLIAFVCAVQQGSKLGLCCLFCTF